MIHKFKTRVDTWHANAKARRAEKKELASHKQKLPSTLFLRFSVKEHVLFAKRLSFLVRAGVPLLESLTLIHKQTRSKRKQKVFDSIIHDVTAGQLLSNSMAKFRVLFGDFAINIIRVGENAGILSQNLIYLAEELEKKHLLQRKIRGALIYPAFITVATLGVTSLLTVFIFPKIMPIFISMDIDLPLTTRILLAVSQYLESWGILTIFGLILAIIAFILARNALPTLRYWSDYLIIKLPIVGSIARAYNASNFCRTLGLLIHSGIHVSEAMYIVADVTKNAVYKKAYTAIADRVMTGEQISVNLEKHDNILPDMLRHLVLIGETSGTLSDSLRYLAELYEAEVDEYTKNLSNSIEPILLMTMGVLVGLIAVSVITPIYEVTKTLQTR